jgi:anthranilate synthase component 2
MIEKILLIDNYDSFSYNLVDFFEQVGASVEVVNNTISAQDVFQRDFDLMVLSPGPSTPAHSGNLLEILREARERVPLFGVCLGLEALVESFGGSLRLTEPRHGKSSPIHHDGTSIFSDLKNPLQAGRYHSLVSDEVPDCFDISAWCSSPNGEKLVMGIRHKTLPIEAVQFHPESVLSFQDQQGLSLIRNVVHSFPSQP